ncbi:hypothetical protein BR93DRAFT_935799 [Coniochaeta sp. PMI_546]|nr:hypothetical protein BR93DRAFT_935799 [Coniochaeta sp. PMI_546]
MADTPTQRVDYQALKAWIAAQEAYEVATKTPAPLTPTQRKAIAELSKSNPSPLTQNVPVGDMDYISILHHFVNASQGNGTTVTYSEALPVPSPSPSPQWSQTLTLTLNPTTPPLVFPSHKTGGLIRLDAVGNRSAPPSFSRIKDAKKYAAQTCVSWLVAEGHLVPSPETGDLAPPSALSPRRRGVPTASGAGTLDVRDDSIPATQRVAELCRKLGFQAPSYELVAGAGTAGGVAGSGVWDGEADFGRDAFRVPEGIGRVQGVYGRKRAREAVAEKVLGYLLEVEEKRERTRRILDEEEEFEG